MRRRRSDAEIDLERVAAGARWCDRWMRDWADIIDCRRLVLWSSSGCVLAQLADVDEAMWTPFAEGWDGGWWVVRDGFDLPERRREPAAWKRLKEYWKAEIYHRRYRREAA